MATSCAYEFQAKHLVFADAPAHQFYHIQWTKNRWVFLGYRFFMAAFCIGWFLYGYVGESANSIKELKLLSNWTEIIMNIHFLIALFVAIYAVVIRNNESANSADHLSWFHRLNWIVYSTTTNAAIIITVFYWVVVGRTRTLAENTRPRTIHLHVTNTILIVIEIFMVAFPARLLHFIYTVGYGLLYTLFLLILHWTGVNSAVYSVLNWATSPGVAVGWTVMAVVAFPIIVNAITFGLYHLRALIARATVLKEVTAEKPAVSTMEMGVVNPAFADTGEQEKPNNDLS